MDVTAFVASGLSAVAAILAAVIAARSAAVARAAEARTALARDLENRLATRKYETYQPMIDLLRRMLDPNEGAQVAAAPETVQALSEFSAWVTIFGADEAVRWFHRFMQGAYNGAPPRVLIRLYAEFVLAARRDLGYPETSVTALDVLGIRVTDIYKNEFYKVATLPFRDLTEQEAWTPPWAIAGEDATPLARRTSG